MELLFSPKSLQNILYELIGHFSKVLHSRGYESCSSHTSPSNLFAKYDCQHLSLWEDMPLTASIQTSCGAKSMEKLQSVGIRWNYYNQEYRYNQWLCHNQLREVLSSLDNNHIQWWASYRLFWRFRWWPKARGSHTGGNSEHLPMANWYRQ